MNDGEIRVCYLPGRESSYVRTRVLLKGMRSAGLIVYDCSYEKRKSYRYILGFWKFLRYKNECDIILIGFFGQGLVPFVRLFTRKKIVFEAFLSAYQTLVFDRRVISKNGLIAKLIRFIELKSCQISNRVLLDTQQHINYFLKQYEGLNRNLFDRSWLSADDSYTSQSSIDISSLKNKKEKTFIVHFHGEFQALHGTKYIIEAAQLLPEAHFRMVGDGAELISCKERANQLGVHNITFYGMVRFDMIPTLINEADICLGIFGDTEKTHLVIPFKVFEGIAVSKPIVTADTAAIRELFRHEENIYLCRPADSEDLAKAIKTLLYNDELRERIAANGNKLFENTCSPECVGRQMRAIFEQELEST